MLPNCDPSLVGDPLLGCSSKLIPCPTPRIRIPFAEPCRPIASKEKRVDFKWEYHVPLKHQYNEYFGSENDDLAMQVKSREAFSKPIKLRRVHVDFDNPYGFPKVAVNDIEEDYEMVDVDEGGKGAGQDITITAVEEKEEKGMKQTLSIFKEHISESTDTDTEMDNMDSADDKKGDSNDNTKKSPPGNIGAIEDEVEHDSGSDDESAWSLPRQRKRPTLPSTPTIEVKLKIGYRNDTMWENNRPFAIVEVIEPNPFKEAIRADPTIGNDKSFRDAQNRHLQRKSIGLDKKNVMMKWYKPYTLTVGRPPRTTEECHVDVSPFQAETAAYCTAQQKGLQGNVMPYHLGFFVLAEHRRTQGIRDVVTQFTDDQVGESWQKYGIFALFELAPGRSLDIFHVVGRNPPVNGKLVEGVKESMDDPQWINENIATSVRRELNIPKATYASLTTLHDAGIGHNNPRGCDVIVYPMVTKQPKLDYYTGKKVMTAQIEYVAVLSGFEKATTTINAGGGGGEDDDYGAFRDDIKHMEELACHWQETGETPEDREEDDEEGYEEETGKGDLMGMDGF